MLGTVAVTLAFVVILAVTLALAAALFAVTVLAIDRSR